jgi:hypothetical protein
MPDSKEHVDSLRFLLQDVIAHELGHAADLASGVIAWDRVSEKNAETPQVETQGILWENKAAKERGAHDPVPRPLRDPTIHKGWTNSASDYVEPPR